MGVYNTLEITSSNPSDRIGGIQEFFGSIEGITSTVDEYTNEGVTYSAVKINIPTIENTSIELLFGTTSDDILNTIVYIKNGDRYLLSPTVDEASGTAGNIKVHSYIDDDCKMLTVCQLGNNGFELVYTKTDNNRYLVGYNATKLTNNTIGYVDISTLNFEDRDSISGIVYTYTNMFPYTAPAGYIDFLGQSYFVNGGERKYVVDILRECSTVALLDSPTLNDGRFVALGTHCLAPVEDEVEGG